MAEIKDLQAELSVLMKCINLWIMYFESPASAKYLNLMPSYTVLAVGKRRHKFKLKVYPNKGKSWSMANATLRPASLQTVTTTSDTSPSTAWSAASKRSIKWLCT